MASSIPASAPTDVGSLRVRTSWLRVHGRRVPWLPIAGVVFIALLGVATIAYIVIGGYDFWDRSTLPNDWDLAFGVLFVLLVLEAARRSTGLIMPIVVELFGAYAFLGPWLPGHWAHRGYDVDSMVGVMYMSLEGIFGTAIDVSATLIIMFTIFGAFLQHSGAGKFFQIGRASCRERVL